MDRLTIGLYLYLHLADHLSALHIRTGCEDTFLLIYCYIFSYSAPTRGRSLTVQAGLRTDVIYFDFQESFDSCLIRS